jgi:signal transduction histidine kinase
MAVARQDILEEVAGYLDFTVEDAQLLRELGPLVRPRFPALVERFYDAIESSEGAHAVLTEGQAQVERLKATLQDWLEGVVGGVYDEAYLQRRLRIGRVHVRIGLDQRYMFSAMNILRRGLHDAVGAAFESMPQAELARWTRPRRQQAHGAIDKICDIELSIMLESYREDYVSRIRASERLATLGQFAASIGHELRNPLAVMETSLHLLRRRLGDDERSARHARRIGDQVTLCGTIIADLLEMARDRAPTLKSVDVTSLAQEAVDAIPQREGAQLELDVPNESVHVNVDPVQIRQVLVNLVMNAQQSVTSQDGQGQVHVRLSSDETTLYLRVEDDGPGLSGEAKERLFEPLFTTRSKGIGLGLSICRRMVEKHGGTISAENAHPKGAVFEVRIPRSTERSE